MALRSGGLFVPQSTNYAKIKVVQWAFLSKNHVEFLVLKSHNFMIRGMVVPQDTVLVLNSYVVVPQYWIMYDLLKIGGQMAPQPHIIYTKVKRSKVLGSYLSKLKRLSPSIHHFFSLRLFHHDAKPATFYYASSITTMIDNKLLQTRHNYIGSYDIQRDLYYQLP